MGSFGLASMVERVRPRGFLKFMILKLLGEKPRHGYEIMEELGRRVDWHPSSGAVYPRLQNMASEGLVKISESREKDGKIQKIYALTEKGKDEYEKLESRKKEIREKFEESLEKWSEFFAFMLPSEPVLPKVRNDMEKLREELASLPRKKAAEASRILESAAEKLRRLSEEKA